MNALKIGAHTKYTFKRIPELAIVSGFNRTATGRNVGQTNLYMLDYFMQLI
jgi:hypothetical protein